MAAAKFGNFPDLSSLSSTILLIERLRPRAEVVYYRAMTTTKFCSGGHIGVRIAGTWLPGPGGDPLAFPCRVAPGYRVVVRCAAPMPQENIFPFCKIFAKRNRSVLWGRCNASGFDAILMVRALFPPDATPATPARRNPVGEVWRGSKTTAANACVYRRAATAGFLVIIYDAKHALIEKKMN